MPSRVLSRAGEPMFTRGDLAKILNVTTLTIANREQTGKYPAPKRDLNNWRVYSLGDVFNLQVLTYGRHDTRPVLSLLHDKGYRDYVQLQRMIDRVLSGNLGASDG